MIVLGTTRADPAGHLVQIVPKTALTKTVTRVRTMRLA